MNALTRSIAALTLLAACGEDAPAPEAPAPAAPAAAPAPAAAKPAAAPAGEADLARATAAAKTLGKTLKGRVQESMKADGPAATVRVCADEAQGMTALVSSQTGVKVGRSSLKLRNEANAGPAWVTAWLEAQGDAKAADVEPLRTVVDGPDGKVARVALPIGIDAPCLVCHGPAESITPEIQAVLSERYPGDAAKGYAPGDLRGAIWAETPATGG